MKNSFVFFSIRFFFLGTIDKWYNILSGFHGLSQGEIHLILKYQPLKV